MTSAPESVIALATRRTEARATKDWALSDQLRDEIAAAGWNVIDTADGFTLVERPPFEQLPDLHALKLKAAALTPAEICIGVIADGWPDDVRECLDALIRYAPQSCRVVVVDCGNVDGVGAVVEELAQQHRDRVQALHLQQPLATVGWSALRMALIESIPSSVHVVMDVSTVLDGDAITQLVDSLIGEVVAAGWRGVNVNVTDAWRSFDDAPMGECDAVLSYLMAVRRDAALESPIDAKAKFYRNADLEWSLSLRAAGGRIVMPVASLSCHQTRHHGYHDSDPEYRDRESRKTYDRLLQRFRNRPEILAPRPQ